MNRMISKFLLPFSLLMLPFCACTQGLLYSENPVAYQYHLKHFGLKGKVKSVRLYGAANNLMTEEQFDQEGRITSSVAYGTLTSRQDFQYDDLQKLISISYQTGSLPPVKYLYQTQSGGEVEYKLYKIGDPLRRFLYKGGLLIKDSSANQFSSQKEYYRYYDYNTRGQLVKRRDYNADGQLNREEIYQYENAVITIRGTSYSGSKGGTGIPYEQKKYFDAQGNLLKTVFIQNGKTETTEYRNDAAGNWVWKTGDQRRVIEYYDSPQPGKDKISSAETKDRNNLVLAENPVAIKYLLRHERLNGKVKKITLKDSAGNVLRQTAYDTRGRVTKDLRGTGRMAFFDQFSYDSASNMILQTMEAATGGKSYYKYAYNSAGDVTRYYIGNPAGTIFYSKRLYQYQDSLLVTDTAYIPSAFENMFVHQYNNRGQIINSKTYNQKTRVLLAETSYEYKEQEGLLLVTIREKTDYSGSQKFETATTIRYYDKSQRLIKEQNIGGTIFSGRPRELTYQFDASGNWISNSKKERREIEYYETSASVPKGSPSTGNNSKPQQTVILDENFDNNNNKWTIWENERSGALFYNGYYRVTNRESNNLSSWLNVPGLAANQSMDFTIETRIFLHTTERGNPNDSYWLLWGIGNNGKDFYAFGIYPDGRFQYGKLVGNNWNAMAGAIRSAVIDTGILKANILRVEKRNQELFFYINRQKVYQAKFESFPAGFTGVGYQFNNKKLVDVDYLYIFQGSKEVAVSAPVNPDDSGYQKELSLSRDSKERAAALAKYLNETYVKTDSLQFSKLVAQKLKQIADIDFYAINEMLTSIKGPKVSEIIKQVMAGLPADQRKIIMAYSQCIIDNYQRRQSGQAELTCPPAHLPQPGFGLGKTVSSDPPKTKPVEAYTQNNPTPVSSYVPLEAQELVGHGYYKDTSFTDYWGDFYAVTKIIQVKSISGDYAEVTYFISNSNQLKNGRILWKQITQYGSPYKPLQKNYNSCRECGGAGTVQASTSYTHTNDYEYTLGVKQKITTTTQSTVSCKKCGGCGFAPNDGSLYEWPAPYISKKKKRP